MSRNRQSAAPLVEIVEMTRAVVVHAADYPSGARVPPHRHAVAQLIYASEGVMTVTTAAGRWVVPPQRGVWVPPRVAHRIRMTGEVHMRTVYLEPGRVEDAPTGCCVVHISPLMRELILRAVSFDGSEPAEGPEERVVALLVDEIRAARVAPLHLPTPVDSRLLRVTGALRDDPGDARTLDDWSRSAGASARTLARLFLRETGMGFRAWRQQARLLRALERLADGEPVTRVALELGYESPSAFIAMFRRTLGETPGRYFASS